MDNIQNMKIGDKCFFMYGNKPSEGRIIEISFYGSIDENDKIIFNSYKITVRYIFEKDENRLGTDSIEVREIFPTKKALLMHLINLLDKSIDNYRRFENG